MPGKKFFLTLWLENLSFPLTPLLRDLRATWFMLRDFGASLVTWARGKRRNMRAQRFEGARGFWMRKCRDFPIMEEWGSNGSVGRFATYRGMLDESVWAVGHLRKEIYPNEGWL